MPSFVRGAVELGLPSEAATRLVMHGSLTRPAALAVAARAGSTWSEAQEWVTGEGPQKDETLVLTRLDAARLETLRDRLLLGAEF
jgi:hypothetical protein